MSAFGLTAGQFHEYAMRLASGLYPGCEVVSASHDDQTWTLTIDDPGDEFEYALLAVHSDLSWDVI